MKKLSRYLNTELLRMIVYALLGLLALYLFFDFIGQLNDLGKGNFDLLDALAYVLLQTPGRVYELMPIAVLMGTTFALSLLNGQSEITVMRTAGVSLRRLIAWALCAGLLCALFTLVLGEYIVPLSEHKAEQSKLQATDSMIMGQFHTGVWVKDGQSFINISEILPDLTLQKIRIFTFDHELHLTNIREANTGSYQNKGHWLLKEGIVTTFLPNNKGVKIAKVPAFSWRTSISPEMLAVLLVSPNQMSATALYRYIDHLKINKQKTIAYEIAFWNKLFYPFICLSMIVIALPFSMGQRRDRNIGIKLFIGIMVGLSFYFFSKVIAHLGQLYIWSPLFVVIIPPLFFLGASGYLLWRQERR